jgi:hypothetical protein
MAFFQDPISWMQGSPPLDPLNFQDSGQSAAHEAPTSLKSGGHLRPEDPISWKMGRLGLVSSIRLGPFPEDGRIHYSGLFGPPVVFSVKTTTSLILAQVAGP